MKQQVLFIQGRTHRSGAQTCLARLLRHETVRAWNPAVVCSKLGWFTQECERIQIPVILEPFPSSRSFSAKLFGNRKFARSVREKLVATSISPTVVHANDHQEGLLALAIARAIGAKIAITLRSSGMEREDYFKYRCNEFDYISAVGEDLTERVQAWDSARKIECVYDGVFEEEFLSPKELSSTPPLKILVIGSPQRLKGWADLTEAVYLLEQERSLPGMEFDFTGDLPAKNENDLKTGRLSSRCNFLGRVEDFRDFVRGYDLAINPSRMESFGMAAVEVLVAGIPLLSSRTGVMEEVQTNARMLFEPGMPAALANALRTVLQGWGNFDFGIASSQRHIRQKFMIGHAAADLDRAYRQLQG